MVSGRLGAATTLGVYVHFSAESDREAAAAARLALQGRQGVSGLPLRLRDSGAEHAGTHHGVTQLRHRRLRGRQDQPGCWVGGSSAVGPPLTVTV
jgi:hypothetical protein